MASPFERAASVLAADSRVDAVYGFGSHVRGTAGPRSDIDLAVLLSRDIRLVEELRLRANVVDVLGRDDIDLVRLNSAPPLLRHEIISTGHRLFVRDADAVDRFERRCLREYLDTRYLRTVQRRLARERSHDAAA